MKILHISTTDEIGGAARSAARTHLALLQAGYDSTMFVLYTNSNFPNVKVFRPSRDFFSRVRRSFLRKRISRDFGQYKDTRPPGCEIFSDDRSVHSSALLSQMPDFDLINLHWVANFVDYRSFFAKISPRIPIFWTLHDMNPFTGGCHFNGGCSRFQIKCMACPQLGSQKESDLSEAIWGRKRSSYSNFSCRQLHLISPSIWMAKQIKKSKILGDFPLTVVPYGVSTDDFSPRDKEFSRDLLGLPQNAMILLFVAHSVENSRKGMALLGEALSNLSIIPNILLLSVGTGNPKIGNHMRQVHLGPIRNDRYLSLTYSAADLFVIPSLEDNLPNTVLESMACGTPVVGFKAGGIPDMIRPGVTGLLAPVGDVAALRSSIIELLGDPEKRRTMGKNCRRIAVNEYSLEVVGKNYGILYQQFC